EMSRGLGDVYKRQQLNYKASYVVVNANATSGHANAMVNFSVEYE
ncbi:hypothetical protein ACX3V1_29745, partial [Escherichia coli]